MAHNSKEYCALGMRNTAKRLTKLISAEINPDDFDLKTIRIELDTLKDQIDTLEYLIHSDVDPIMHKLKQALAFLPDAIIDTDITGEITISTGLTDTPNGIIPIKEG
jgi:ribonuclease BN (tRNA processing enzyme)